MLLKLENSFGITDNLTDEFFIKPDNYITIKDALNDGKLFVNKDDMTKLISNESVDLDDVKPEGSLPEKLC